MIMITKNVEEGLAHKMKIINRWTYEKKEVRKNFYYNTTGWNKVKHKKIYT